MAADPLSFVLGVDFRRAGEVWAVPLPLTTSSLINLISTIFIFPTSSKIFNGCFDAGYLRKH